jgi:hypothetical protein
LVLVSTVPVKILLGQEKSKVLQGKKTDENISLFQKWKICWTYCIKIKNGVHPTNDLTTDISTEDIAMKTVYFLIVLIIICYTRDLGPSKALDLSMKIMYS